MVARGGCRKLRCVVEEGRRKRWEEDGLTVIVGDWVCPFHILKNVDMSQNRPIVAGVDGVYAK